MIIFFGDWLKLLTDILNSKRLDLTDFLKIVNGFFFGVIKIVNWELVFSCVATWDNGKINGRK